MAGPANAGCDTWSLGTSGDWFTKSNWSAGVPKSSGTDVCITDGTSAVTLNGNASVADLTQASGNTLNYGFGSSLHVFGSSVDNAGTINLNGGSGKNAFLYVGAGSLNLSGGGTVDLTVSSGGGSAFLRASTNGNTLTNVDNLIEGAGNIGDSTKLVVDNEATINADAAGQILTLNKGNGGVTNTGLLEATGGGQLNLYSGINNTNGNITADGGTVAVTNATITGGTLNTANGGLMETSGTAHLDDVTLSAGSTYAAGKGTSTFFEDTITNNGTFTINGGGGGNAFLDVNSSNVTLEGGGTVDLTVASGGGKAYVSANTGGNTLTNVDNLIEGAGDIGDSKRLNIVNDTDGTIYSNAGGTIAIGFGGGSITNNGTFMVDAGSTIHMANGLFTNFGSATLTGGTYEVFGTSTSSGTLKIDELGHKGGEIVNNNAVIYLDGVNSNIVDSAGKDALSKFSNNESDGFFEIINGRNFTSPGTFANAGGVYVGATSTFSAGGGGSADYNQSSGVTTVDGTLQAMNINNKNFSVLLGTGTVTGNVANSALVEPGDLLPGKLTVGGNFTQTASGVLEIDIAGRSTGQYSQLDVSGHTALDGTLELSLDNGFRFSGGEQFDIINTDPFSGDFTALNVDGSLCTSGGPDIWNCSTLPDGLYLTEEFLSNDDQLWLTVNGQVVPEPGSLTLLAGALGALGAGVGRRKKSAVARG